MKRLLFILPSVDAHVHPCKLPEKEMIIPYEETVYNLEGRLDEEELEKLLTKVAGHKVSKRESNWVVREH